MSCDNGGFFGATCNKFHVVLIKPTRLKRLPAGFRVYAFSRSCHRTPAPPPHRDWADLPAAGLPLPPPAPRQPVTACMV